MRQDNEIRIIYGTDPHTMTRKLLENMDLKSRIPSKNALIGLKPNLVVARSAETGATTHPEILEEIIRYLQENGFRNLLILEGSWVGDDTKRAFLYCGYRDLSKKYGVPLFDTKDDQYTIKEYDGIKMEISKKALSVDYLINLPVLKGHCQTMMTGALKNMKGCLSDREKRHFHTLGLHRPIACLGKILHSDFILVDGLCGDLDFEEGGNPVRMNRMICGTDPLLVDCYLASCMGFDPFDIGYLKLAQEFGVGSSDLENADIVELNKDESKVVPSSSGLVRNLSKYTVPKDACSACYANLIQALKRLDDEGRLHRGCGPICIGQGYRGKTGDGIGVGACTHGLCQSLGGCPPKTPEIVSFLKENL